MDLLGKMLEIRHEDRISIQDAINHPFFDPVRQTVMNETMQKYPNYIC